MILGGLAMVGMVVGGVVYSKVRFCMCVYVCA